MKSHIETGGTVALCPEGQVSATPYGLQPFRRGSFTTPIAHGMPVYGLTMVGCPDVWPKAAAMGGLPGTVHVSLDRLVVPHENESAAELAERCQVAMQAVVDRLEAERKSA